MNLCSPNYPYKTVSECSPCPYSKIAKNQKQSICPLPGQWINHRTAHKGLVSNKKEQTISCNNKHECIKCKLDSKGYIQYISLIFCKRQNDKDKTITVRGEGEERGLLLQPFKVLQKIKKNLAKMMKIFKTLSIMTAIE